MRVAFFFVLLLLGAWAGFAFGWMANAYRHHRNARDADRSLRDQDEELQLMREELERTRAELMHLRAAVADADDAAPAEWDEPARLGHARDRGVADWTAADIERQLAETRVPRREK